MVGFIGRLRAVPSSSGAAQDHTSVCTCAAGGHSETLLGGVCVRCLRQIQSPASKSSIVVRKLETAP